jgi:hypothetical protein
VRSRGIVGKRIVRVHQAVEDLGGSRGRRNVVRGLELEDGTMLCPVTVET